MVKRRKERVGWKRGHGGKVNGKVREEEVRRE